MRLIFYGDLRNRFGTEVTMQANTVAEALEGFSRQVDWPSDTLVEVVGFDTEDKLQSAAEEVHIMPSLRGGGGKFGSIIMGALMVAVAFIPGVGTALSTSLLLSGGLMVAQGIVGLFMKAPKMGKNEDPEASKYLAANKNTTAVGTPITMAWGRIDLAGHWLSLQSDSNNLSYGVFPANPT